MPASFRFPDRDVDVWFPSPVDAPYAQSRQSTWYTGVGRLRPGVTLEQARADLSAVQARLAQQFPDPDRKIGVELRPLKQDLVGGIGRALWLLFGAVSVLLLIACTNIAALFVARGAARRPEIALRLSLGASRAAIAGLVLAETLLLALVGGASGCWSPPWPRPRSAPSGPSCRAWTRWWWTPGSCSTARSARSGVALVSGLAPAVRAMREDAFLASGESGRTQVSGSQRLQWALVGGQVALSVTLLMGAGLLVRSFHALARVEPGFEKSGVLTFRMSGSWNETADYPALVARVDRTIDTLGALPGRPGGGHHRLGAAGNADAVGSRASRSWKPAATPTGASSATCAWCRRSTSRPCASRCSRANGASGAPSARAAPHPAKAST